MKDLKAKLQKRVVKLESLIVDRRIHLLIDRISRGNIKLDGKAPRGLLVLDTTLTKGSGCRLGWRVTFNEKAEPVATSLFLEEEERGVIRIITEIGADSCRIESEYSGYGRKFGKLLRRLGLSRKLEHDRQQVDVASVTRGKEELIRYMIERTTP